MDYKLLYKLLESESISGYEYNLQKELIKEMDSHYDNLYTNHNYNVTFGYNKGAKTSIVLGAHIDEIGLVVEKINNDGTIKVRGVGGVSAYNYISQHVNIITANGKVNGVFCYLPGLGKNEISISDLILDIGASSKEEASKLVSIGDCVAHNVTYRNLTNNYLSARALDDKIGVFIACEVLKKVKERESKVGLLVSSIVGEETTGRGASSIYKTLNPSCFIALDVTFATDIKYSNSLKGDISLGKGPVLTVGSLMNTVIHQKMIEACDKLNLQYQLEVSTARTFTDVDNVYRDNIPAYLISIPLRYMHSSVEVCCLKDVEEIIEMLTEFVCNLEESINFNILAQ